MTDLQKYYESFFFQNEQEKEMAKPFFIDKPRKSKRKKGGFGNNKKFI